ncbi:MAG: hypothetical protein K1X85_06675 [Ignavibacteria bacterium]|nr:hypothetical protein [Ignavibacteria bacterium]
MKRLYSVAMRVVIVLAVASFIYSCSDDDTTNNPNPTGPDAKSINGTVAFVDNSFVTSGGVYLISAYPSSGWPPTGGPAAYDTISISGSTLSYNYKLVDLNPGDYVVSVGFRKTSGGQSPIMSVYGCDTARFASGSTCFLNPPKKATIGSENQGVEGINMLSWADTTKKVY